MKDTPSQLHPDIGQMDKTELPTYRQSVTTNTCNFLQVSSQMHNTIMHR